jgi:mRNA interferase RelE/StbE
VPWQVRISSTAEKYYMRLVAQTKGRIKKELEVLSHLSNPLEHQAVKRLTGELKGFCRLRIGQYRVVFAIVEATHTIAVVNIAPRGDAYK